MRYSTFSYGSLSCSVRGRYFIVMDISDYSQMDSYPSDNTRMTSYPMRNDRISSYPPEHTRIAENTGIQRWMRRTAAGKNGDQKCERQSVKINGRSGWVKC